MRYDGENSRTEATASVKYNPTLKEIVSKFKSIIVIAWIFDEPAGKQRGETNGGRHGTRTHDPRVANAVLSQLS